MGLYHMAIPRPEGDPEQMIAYARAIDRAARDIHAAARGHTCSAELETLATDIRTRAGQVHRAQAEWDRMKRRLDERRAKDPFAHRSPVGLGTS